MSRILIVAIGSRGDVAPLVGLGTRLVAAGHHVTVAAYSIFAELVTEAGLGFCQVGEHVSMDDIATTTNPAKEILAFLAPRGYREQGRAIIAAVADLPADILLFSPLAESAGHQLAEAKQIPSAGLRLQPLSRTAAYPPAVLGLPSLGHLGNRFVGWLSTATLDRLYNHAIRDLRTELNLPKASARQLRRRRTDADWPILYGYSPLVVPRAEDWRPGIDVTGYWWSPTPPDWQPSEELVQFLKAGPAPVFVGFGSMVTSPKQSAKLATILATALAELGVRAIVQAGWARLGLERAQTRPDKKRREKKQGDAPSGAALLAASPDVLTIADAPYDWLFPRMAAVVHHCGAGTAAAGLRAGIPAVGVPLVGDQPFWARRLRALGVSAATVPQYRLNAMKLTKAIHAALTDPTLTVKARELAQRIAAEDGATAALTIINELTDS